ncbi:hypothetical protein Cch01nite_12930 [Cellulomonas chitinilytica]|uniref:Uncharacterized protein n=1 Tax=Cellulomonas chitinilytica TaxID=398759 RepID=A0A919P357_9CELL|nr:hypothetical protein [Cellulomonas chitinilytica]GIG20569.1 hypothetical protein Cch01nite_12930 [Cellulomonas chitinilytica]
MSDHTFVAGSLRDLNRPVPRLVMTGWRTRVPMPRPGLVFPILLVTSAIVGLVVEAQKGWTSTVPWRTHDLPLAVVWGFVVIVGVAVFVERARDPRPSWYRWWSLLDSREEPDGLRLVSGRARADHPGVLVRRGDHVAFLAIPVQRGRNERTFAYRVAAPGGELLFEAPIFMEKLSLAPLDDAASRWGFTVSTHGEALRIRRAVVGGLTTSR